MNEKYTPYNLKGTGEEINKTYGVVETKGIFQYDYESQLRNAATQ